MHQSKLRVGIVGVGGIGLDQHVPGWAKIPFAEVTAVADSAQTALAKASAVLPNSSRFEDWQDLVALTDLDIVDVCTPNTLHTPVALAALRSGKHVLCEKPMATTATDVRTLAEAAKASKVIVMAAQQLRYDKAAVQLKRLIDAGTVGDIYYARAQWLRRRLLPALATFTERRLSGGGAALDIGVHVLDLACWFMGSPQAVSVSGSAGTFLANRTDLAGDWGEWDRGRLDVEDFAAAFVRFANGAVLTLETSWLAFHSEPETIRLQCYGTRGGLVWPDGLIVGETNRAPWNLRLTDQAKTSAHHDEIRAFAEAVRDGLPSPIPVAETLQGIRVLEALYRSAELRREVTLD
jgi:predicted dehydrogenase